MYVSFCLSEKFLVGGGAGSISAFSNFSNKYALSGFCGAWLDVKLFEYICDLHSELIQHLILVLCFSLPSFSLALCAVFVTLPFDVHRAVQPNQTKPTSLRMEL